MRIIFLSFILITIFAHAEVTPWEVKFKAYVNGLPSDVVTLLQRTDICNHWGGEEPYNKERAKQIAEAMKKSKCDSVDTDTKQLLEKYKGEPKVVEKIKNFSSLQ